MMQNIDENMKHMLKLTKSEQAMKRLSGKKKYIK